MSGGKSERDRPGFAQDDEPDDFGALIVELLAGGTNKDAPVPDTQLLTISHLFPGKGGASLWQEA